MKILVVGSGGREHALCWKIGQSPLVEKLYCAPGNAGTQIIAENVEIESSDIKGLTDFASKEKIDLTVIGPEDPLCMGIVDEFEQKELKIFGPSKKAAELEGSKIFAKQFMERHKIPTPKAMVAESPKDAKKILSSDEFSFPLVVKADGLAAGKGAIICLDQEKAEETVNAMMVEKKFGEAGSRILIEEYLAGKEASFIVITDGTRILPLVTTMDHKPAYDGNKGPNTGGMGAISPSPFIDQELFTEIIEKVIQTTITRMLEEGRKFRGVLYAGLMLTEEGPQVLEFNCRFGDPETQPQVLRMKSDLVETLLAAIEGDILEKPIQWSNKPSGCVILASGGYPGKYEKGKLIKGLDRESKITGVTIFHAGTSLENEQFYTNGGRVLGVCATENSLSETMDKIYQAISEIEFENMYFRHDIGAQKMEG
ncbi:MAG: phosphoribosylamine--glycine ligase [Candidatus Aminicenantes bacterium]|nr:phosphoribosylamine--glycine ligase [Candidatus Aminicenantes bacterium]